MTRLVLFALILVVGWAVFCRAQAPDRRGEISLDSSTYHDVYARAPVPVSKHVRNEGGSDGAGLCVISSVLAAGMTQGVPGLDIAGLDAQTNADKPGKGSLLWRTAKARRGGYSPAKLEALLREVMPSEKYVSYTGTDTAPLESMSKQGYTLGVTMNTGQLYGYRAIHHMVNAGHYERGGYACIIDNNDPGRFHWMPTAEFDRRWIDGGVGWMFAWLRKPSKVGPMAIVLFYGAAGAAIIARFYRLKVAAT